MTKYYIQYVPSVLAEHQDVYNMFYFFEDTDVRENLQEAKLDAVAYQDYHDKCFVEYLLDECKNNRLTLDDVVDMIAFRPNYVEQLAEET